MCATPSRRPGPTSSSTWPAPTPYFDDRLGRLALTKAGLAERDRLIFHYTRRAGIPLAITMAGGYARRIEDTVDIHFQTVAAAATL